MRILNELRITIKYVLIGMGLTFAGQIALSGFDQINRLSKMINESPIIHLVMPKAETENK